MDNSIVKFYEYHMTITLGKRFLFDLNYRNDRCDSGYGLRVYRIGYLSIWSYRYPTSFKKIISSIF